MLFYLEKTIIFTLVLLIKPITVEQDYNRDSERNNGFYSKKMRAGKRRTYFFDVRATKGNDFYLTITESKKRPNQNGYDSHKIFLYKEDFKKFVESLEDTIKHIKTELMPDFDFENFTRESYFEQREKDDDSSYPSEAPDEEYVPKQEAYTNNTNNNSVHDNMIPSSHENVDSW